MEYALKMKRSRNVTNQKRKLNDTGIRNDLVRMYGKKWMTKYGKVMDLNKNVRDVKRELNKAEKNNSLNVTSSNGVIRKMVANDIKKAMVKDMKLNQENTLKKKLLRNEAQKLYGKFGKNMVNNVIKYATNLPKTYPLNSSKIKNYVTIKRQLQQNTPSHERINNPTYVPINPESDPSIFRCSTMEKVEELAPYQQAILACLQNLYETNVKRYKGYCCTQIKTEDGKDTRAWKQVETIQEYVYGVAQKETRYELWKNLSSRGSAYNDVIRHLTHCKDMQFPEIVKNRHVWSFKNGIFIGKEWSAQTGLYESNFYTYESREFKNLDHLYYVILILQVNACRFLDFQQNTFICQMVNQGRCMNKCVRMVYPMNHLKNL